MASTTPTVWRTLGHVYTPLNGVEKQDNSRVVALADGGFLVTWEDSSQNLTPFQGIDIGAQRYDILGNPVGPVFYGNQMYQDENQRSVSLLALPGGEVFIAYQSEDAAMYGDGENIEVQMFDTANAPIRDEDFRQGICRRRRSTTLSLRLPGSAADAT